MKKRYAIIMMCGILSTCFACSTTSYPSVYPDSPAQVLTDLHIPQALGVSTFSDGTYAIVDTSNHNDGYIMAKQLQASNKRLKLLIEKDGQKYTYDINTDANTAFPLQMGNGEYEIRIMRQSKDDVYTRLATQKIQVEMKDELAPYRYPSQIVPYDAASETIKKAFELVKNDQNDLDRIAHIYEYVITNIVYDDEKAIAVQNKFVLPDPDTTLASKKGICFDYASLLTAMLRSQNIPTRLVTGYTDIEYHAWVEIYLNNEGWINPKVYFEKENWSRMDPTFVASDMDYEGKYEQVYVY